VKSPFPGMDPFLENIWRDVHVSLIVHSSAQLNEQLPNQFRCRIEERETGLEETPDRYLKIIDLSLNRNVVTLIEFLSHAHKVPGPTRELYRKRRAAILATNVNFVEIDLLRAGVRIEALDDSRLPSNARTLYRAIVRRGSAPKQLELFPISLREALPRVPIPLPEPFADAILPLQPLLEQCYRLGRYDDIDYSRLLEPPLEESDAEWASTRIAADRRF
jgi:hypothetical protein